MDTYLEHIIKQKYTVTKLILTVLLYFITIILGIFILGISLVVPTIPFLFRQLALPVVIGLFFGVWWLTSKFNVEYEYILTNDELDVDRIIARRTRKRMLTVSVKKFEDFGKADGVKFKNFLDNNHYQVCFDAGIAPDSVNRYYATFMNKNGESMILIFNPTRAMLESMVKYNPRVIKIEN